MTPAQIAEAWLHLGRHGGYFRYNSMRSDGDSAEEQLSADRAALASMIQQSIDAAVAAEREACAKEAYLLRNSGFDADQIVATIRSRGKP